MSTVEVPRNRAERRHPNLFPKDPPPDLLKVPEAARRLGVASETLYRLVRANKFPPAVKIGTAIRISVPRLEAFLHGEATRKGSGPEAANAQVEGQVAEPVPPSAPPCGGGR